MAKLRKILVALLAICFISVLLLLHQLNSNTQPHKTTPRNYLRHGPRATLAPSSVIQGYCNQPDGINVGSEGLPPVDYKLVSVTAVVRHGNRLPMPGCPPLGPLSSPQVSCRLKVSESSMPSLLQTFIEKTDVAPKAVSRWPFPLRPDSDWCADADLTQIGVEQHIRNGLLFKEAYGQQLDVRQKNVKVVSTARGRTYQSVVALVFGLLGEDADLESLDVESTNSSLLCRAAKPSLCDCPKADELYTRGIKALKNLQRTDKNFVRFKRSIQKSLEKAPSSVSQFTYQYPWDSAHDILISRLCRRQQPCQEGFCFTESQADLNWRSLNLYHQSMSTNSDLILSSKYYMYYFLKELVERLSRHSTQPNLVQDTLSVYSAHDVTLRPLLLALELPLHQWPPLASRLIFELYKPTAYADTEEYLLKVIYNGKDLTPLLPFCLSKVGWTQSGCALKDFIHYFHNMFDGGSYDSVCSS